MFFFCAATAILYIGRLSASTPIVLLLVFSPQANAVPAAAESVTPRLAEYVLTKVV